MIKKYVFSSLMIIFGVAALALLFLPFYRLDISGVYGDTLIEGYLTITGLAFIIGGFAQTGGYFEGRNYMVVFQPIILVIAIIALILTVLAIISLVSKNKTSALFFGLNISSGLISFVMIFITTFAFAISNVSVNGEFITDALSIQREGLDYGAYLMIFAFALYFIFAFVLAFVSLFDYRMSLKEEKVTYNKENHIMIGEERKARLTYEDKLQLENKNSGRLLSFTKKEKKKEENKEIDLTDNKENVVENTEAKEEKIKDVTKKSSPYDRDFSSVSAHSSYSNRVVNNEAKDNKYGVKTTTGVFDINYKEEVSTSRVSPKDKEKSLEESLADLDKLYKEHTLSKEDYDKYKEALISKYNANNK